MSTHRTYSLKRTGVSDDGPVLRADRAVISAARLDQPYAKGLGVDPDRHPLAASVAKELYAVDSEANFEYGLSIVLTGMRAEVLGE
jgi:hypothetical protein